MKDAKDDLLSRADEFERMAELAASEVLRCRYRSMARYWSILAGELEQTPAPQVRDAAPQVLHHAA